MMVNVIARILGLAIALGSKFRVQVRFRVGQESGLIRLGKG